MECPKIKVSGSDYKNNSLKLWNVLDPEWIIFEYKKIESNIENLRIWEFENLNENNNWHHDANGLEEYLSHDHQKTNDGPDAHPEWFIFGIQKKSQAIFENLNENNNWHSAIMILVVQ